MYVLNIIDKLATWRNGYAEDCKSSYPSSILGVASKKILSIFFLNFKTCTVFAPKVFDKELKVK